MTNGPKGIGIDLCDAAGFRKRPYGEKHKRFYERIFTDGEIAYCREKQDPGAHFAARFAAKEALIKAAGFGLKNVKDIEVRHDKTGKPVLYYRARPMPRARVSVSQTAGMAVAVVIIW
ncbi:MAG: holo-ACP synthase [Patescibacteria group bacterium]